MNIHEYQAKQLFKLYGIAVPDGLPAESPVHAEQVARELGGSAWAVKAQVHAGGRGKAGGVTIAKSYDDIVEFSRKILGTQLVTKQTGPEGLPVEMVFVEKTSQIDKEFYLSCLVDRGSERVIFIASSAGGMDIEEVAETSPDQIVTFEVSPAAGLQPYQCRNVAFAFGFKGDQLKKLEKIMSGMYALLLEKDANQIEINPLVTTDTGDLLALDAKINFDDNALAAHADITAMRDAGQEDEKEHKAQQHGLNYITLDGTIGCMVNGAGLAMATMDLVKLKGGKPANFLDVGGGASTERVAEAFKLILSDKNVKAVLVNIFGGIVKCDIIAEGILAAVKEVGVNVPVVVRLEGTNAPAGRKILSESGLNLIAAEDLAVAAEQIVALAEGV
ncbi:ADP-forming succinate--CoA ligase subunit beta [Methylicorpusculum oleiharenae]|uniref:ADP-forming succinate--CoA ligase subunit beta n=1 Tax=Methylicorpusculum oleiharenae TaxID=1338687 RepID=UPI001358C006|nr:ADP-forming succinate--CoA ligase subunit beta [Methylicorpusculum oleiharenae]MCD2450248.1 ADP-forming succinate--CoA ligase subunit beta [Methylicorpusculum oleiharenae]